MKNLLEPLAKSVQIPIELPAPASAADAGIHGRSLGSVTATLIISNEQMENEESGFLIKGVTKTIKNESMD